MGFPNLDSFRNRSSSSNNTNNHFDPKTIHSKTDHFKPLPNHFQYDNYIHNHYTTSNTLHAANTRGKGGGGTLKNRDSQQSLSKRDPFARIDHHLPPPIPSKDRIKNVDTDRVEKEQKLSGNDNFGTPNIEVRGKDSSRPNLPWGHSKNHSRGRPVSGSSFGTDFFVEQPEQFPPPQLPSSQNLGKSATASTLSYSGKGGITPKLYGSNKTIASRTASQVNEDEEEEEEEEGEGTVTNHKYIQYKGVYNFASESTFGEISGIPTSFNSPIGYHQPKLLPSTSSFPQTLPLKHPFATSTSPTSPPTLKPSRRGNIPMMTSNILEGGNSRSRNISTTLSGISSSRGDNGRDEEDEGYDDDDEEGEGERGDRIGCLPDKSFTFGNNRSTASIGKKVKADKMLGLETEVKLCSLFMISGIGGTDTSKWVPADTESTARVQPLPDSLGFYWRPEILGSAFSGPATEHFEKAMTHNKKINKNIWPALMKPPAPGANNVYVPDAGPNGAEKLIAKTVKFAHPRDVEVINTSLTPNTTAHYFSFTLPSFAPNADAARQRLNSVQTVNMEQQRSMVSVASFDAATTIDAKRQKDLAAQTEITYYGATLTVWTSSEEERTTQLTQVREQLQKKGNLDSILQAPMVEPLPDVGNNGRGGGAGAGRGRRHNMPWMPYPNTSMTDLGESDNDTIRSGNLTDRGGNGVGSVRSWGQSLNMNNGQYPSNMKTEGRTAKSTMDSMDMGIGPLKAKEGDVFWMPYALTLVSRYPIYDTMIDYIRTSWSLYQKSGRRNLHQMCKVLNRSVPRPGELYRLSIGKRSDGDEVTIEATFPGSVDFDRGLLKTDFQLWPLFQAVDVDSILTCVEIALSNSGKVIFTSQYSAMLCLAVHTLRYMVELRGWNGISMPVVHSRDVPFVIEDPGPYIVGLSMECRYMLPLPNDAAIVDLDNSNLTLKKPPLGVITPRSRREKTKTKIYEALGQQYPLERSIPVELKIAFPNGRFRPFNRTFFEGNNQPHFLGERLRCPPWWKRNEVMGIFDKIMVDKHKKPNLMQRMMGSGMNKMQAELSAGEQLAKTMMRRRALHYVETRDDLENKVAKINSRLMQLMQESEKHRKQFEIFEKQADILTDEALRLRDLIETEQREAERLQDLTREQRQNNQELEERLKVTENARAVAMRQLSDMQESIHDLEREREAIMTIIETQITSAIEGLPPSDSNDLPSSPQSTNLTVSSLGNSHRGQFRPSTGDSAMSRMTGKSDGISVLGMAKRGYNSHPMPGISGMSKGEKRQSLDSMGMVKFGQRGDEVANRIANIQAKVSDSRTEMMRKKIQGLELMEKLELALSGVGRGRSPSLSTLKPYEEEKEKIEVIEKKEGGATNGLALSLDSPAISALKRAGSQKSTPLTSLRTLAQQRSGQETRLRPETASSSNNDHLPTDGVPARERSVTPSSIGSERKATAVELGLIKPGQLRIKKKRVSQGPSPDSKGATSANGSATNGSAAVRQETEHFNEVERHSKGMTVSTTGTTDDGDLVVTPSASALQPNSWARMEGDEAMTSKAELVTCENEEKVEETLEEMLEEQAVVNDGAHNKRLSTMSNKTVAFGPVH